MKQAVIDSSCIINSVLTDSASLFHHLIRVRRMKKGDSIEAIDEKGLCYILTLLSSDGGKACFSVHTVPQKNPQETSSTTPIFVVQSILKGSKMDEVLRKLTECGVSAVYPVSTEYTVSDISEKVGKKMDRWRKIVLEAAQQSGIETVPTIHEPLSLSAFLSSKLTQLRTPDTALLFFYELAGTENRITSLLAQSPSLVIVLCGPEGGFSKLEAEKIGSAGFTPLSLGKTILRAETAPIFALGAIQTILREQSWITD